MEFASIEQIRHYFNISGNDQDGIRRHLRQLLKQVHPDTRPGACLSEHEQDLLVHITRALACLNEQSAARETTDLVKAVTSLVPPDRAARPDPALERLTAQRAGAARAVGRALQFSLGGAVLAMTLLWLFPNLAAPHPVLSRISTGHPVFLTLWIGTTLLALTTWAVLRMWRTRDETHKNSLRLDRTRDRLFADFLQTRSDGPTVFYRDQLVLFLETTLPPWSGCTSVLLGRPRPIDPELAEALAGQIIDRAMASGVICRQDAPALRERYRVCGDPRVA